MSDVFKLYACCIPVKGYNQSYMYDLQRPEMSNAIPNSLYEILVNHRDKETDSIKKLYGNKYDKIIDDYFSFLLRNEFGFICKESEIKNFPKIDLKWESPLLITNMIIEIGELNSKYINEIFLKAIEIDCNALQIRFISRVKVSDVFKLIKSIKDSRILSIELLFFNPIDLNLKQILKLIDEEKRIQKVFIYDCSFGNIESEDNIVCTNVKFDPNNHCGIISPEYFCLNIDMFTESQCFNSCLNRKLCVDKSGSIKNCLSINENFGNVKGNNITEIIKSDGFQKYWNITKDEIEVCSDCEFRYMCTDCRAYIKDINNKYSQPLKCDYNPYISKWKGEKGWKSVDEFMKNRLD